MFGSSPKRGQAKLSAGGFFEDTFLGIGELANERIVESGLPFLNGGHFEAAVVCSLSVYWDGSPDIQVVVFTPIAQSEFFLHQSFIGELKILPGATVLPVQSVMHGRANIELGLHVGNVDEMDIDALRLEKWS